jgi:hypothetical protein
MFEDNLEQSIVREEQALTSEGDGLSNVTPNDAASLQRVLKEQKSKFEVIPYRLLSVVALNDTSRRNSS